MTMKAQIRGVKKMIQGYRELQGEPLYWTRVGILCVIGLFALFLSLPLSEEVTFVVGGFWIVLVLWNMLGAVGAAE